MTIPKAVHIAGVVGGIAAGVAAIIAAITTKQVAYGIWGGAFIAAAIIGAVAGAVASPRVGISPPSVGAKYTEVPDKAWFAVLGVLVIAIICTFIFPPWR